MNIKLLALLNSKITTWNLIGSQYMKALKLSITGHLFLTSFGIIYLLANLIRSILCKIYNMQVRNVYINLNRIADSVNFLFQLPKDATWKK